MLGLIADAVDDRSARGIAAAVSRLVSAGDLPTGARLPTVRDVARALGVSPTTVSEAWQSLAQAGAIQTRGRSGSFVAAPVLPRGRMRYARLASGLGNVTRDFSTGVPDHDLLPSLAGSLARVGDARLTTSYLDAAVLPPLETALRQRWPYPPDRLTVVDGALDALDRVIAAVVRFGDHVLVENPTFPPVLDLLEAAGATVVGVPMDEHGMRPDALGAALTAYDPVAVFLQPRAHNPTGTGLSARRVAELAAELAAYPQVTIVEDDHAGAIASAPPVSLGTQLPDRTVHIAGFSKSHGPDLRLAALGGPAEVITAVADRRLLGPGWSSRLLQAVLLDLLTSPEAAAQIEAARDTYTRRRTTLLRELAERGVSATAADGINLWMTVEDEQAAMLSLAAHGIAVAPGAPFCVTPLGADHVRITVGLIHDDHAELAGIFAAAARAGSGGGTRARPYPRGWR
ncbi:aminotransferase-like domain-containing protein [Couchioplanes caeruleus]|uniref:GntR family transcriptional regulator n=2 Tax=Couchioplanes caeruleus TaxID=56438 RepID=A0A1K0FNE8_9ACTN|nr:aminotransferase class I/II-fold pyridoxal phosphate-dependent enzyme [Couchioplanes caeruleus]OJF14359.1 GntR family transcriptional regulator [Couchioplanes caeruleus subsp. caeruleus]ROP34141.1 DNA-binding transcriptional MocR family regulator [Couchioplanes caeruleus]